MNNRECFIESRQIEEKPVHNNAAEFNDYVENIGSKESIEDQKRDCIELGESVIDSLIDKNESFINQIEEIYKNQNNSASLIRNKIGEWRWTVHDETEPLAEAFYHIEKEDVSDANNEAEPNDQEVSSQKSFDVIQDFVEEINKFDSSEINMASDNAEELRSQTIRSFKKAMDTIINAKAKLTEFKKPDKSKTYQELAAAFK